MKKIEVWFNVVHQEKVKNIKKPRKNRAIRAAGGIVYRQRSGEPEFLILQHKYGKYWSFPKGRRERGESSLETAKREIQEETGVSFSEFKLLEKISKTLQYFVRRGKRLIPKEVSYYLVRFSKSVEVNLSTEHIAYKWLKFDEALAQITHDNSKQLLSEVYYRIKNLDNE